VTVICYLTAWAVVALAATTPGLVAFIAAWARTARQLALRDTQEDA
jgi:predicted metal-binding membrane protein